VEVELALCQRYYFQINEGTSASLLTAQVTPAWLARCAVAMEVQLNRDLSTEWGGNYAVRAGSSAEDIAPGELVFVLRDVLPDAPLAIAYHSTDGAGVAVAFLGLDSVQAIDDISTGISHELCEAAVDPGANRWADDGAGREWALEACDAVESNGYPIDIDDGGTPIRVSDFLMQSFFVPGHAGPYSHMGGPPMEFGTAPGGYQVVRQTGGGETQVQGSIRPMRRAKLAHWSSRVARRRGL
jgi:hypothetical protein